MGDVHRVSDEYILRVLARLQVQMALARHPRAFDIALVLAFGVAGQASAWLDGGDAGPKAVTVPVALMVAAALAWRRRAPLTSLGAVLGAVIAQSLVVRQSASIFFLVVLLVSVFSVAANLSAKRAVWAGMLAVASVQIVTLLDRTSTASDKGFTALVLVGLPWLAGRASRRQGERQAELSVLNDRLRVERDERAREAVAAERVRIARDLHDVIAHSVSVMIVQAGAAEQILHTDPSRADASLHAIRTTGKAALDDMRRLLGVLRTDAEGLALAPQPTIADLQALAERFCSAGLDVKLAVAGEHEPLAPGIEMTAYRVCQEALTNALKHGGGHTTLTLRVAADAVEIAIVDDGSGKPANGSVAGGHGLIGMRERVTLYGGQLDAGPRAEGGFAVQARLPRRHVVA